MSATCVYEPGSATTVRLMSLSDGLVPQPVSLLFSTPVDSALFHKQNWDR